LGDHSEDGSEFIEARASSVEGRRRGISRCEVTMAVNVKITVDIKIKYSLVATILQ
jgi:hypothetical protein